MMLHRHYEEQEKGQKNMTTLSDVKPKKAEFVSEVFPPDETVEAPKRKGRPKKSVEE